jgi:hypothetical protein
MEQQNAYQMLNGGNSGGTKTIFAEHMETNWDRLSGTERSALGSIKYMTCPSRRSPPQMKDSGSQRGPLADYAVVFIYRSWGDNAAEDNWWNHYEPCDNNHVNAQKGAIRAAQADCSLSGNARYATSRGRDSMARITDGTSNTLIVGEKHIRNDEFGQCCSEADADGSYLFSDGSWREYQVAANLRLRFGKGPQDNGNGADPARDVGFGSYHPGTIQFLAADGSVKGISQTVSESIRRKLGDAGDGQVIEDY